LILLLWWCTKASGQQVLTLEEAVNKGIQSSAIYKASSLKVEQSISLQKTAFNLPNPDLVMESPTGDFYAVGILQPFEFPTVYFKQNQVQKQQTLLSVKQKNITENEVRRFIKLLYSNLQFSEALYKQLKIQDSLYANIRQSAERQFGAGLIDHLAKSFAISQSGEIHNLFVQAQTDYDVTMNQLKIYTGINENILISPLQKMIPASEVLALLPQTWEDSSYLRVNPSMQYWLQAQQVSYKSLSLQRNRALPGLVLGYLNQGPRETVPSLKFRVGVRIPLWFGQYQGSINAAKTEIKISEQNTNAQKQQLSAGMKQALGDYSKFLRSLEYYEQTGLRQADDIINTAMRFFQSGQTDYINYLRSTNDAYLVKIRYLETLRNYNQAVINLYFLTGTN
jgi:outer membrane protein TolC